LLRLERKLAVVKISRRLVAEIKKQFSEVEGNKIFDTLESLADNPRKGRVLTNVSGYVIKEIKHKKWRFYAVADGHVLRFGTEDQLHELLIKFVRMSEKKNQQATINSIKKALESFGFLK